MRRKILIGSLVSVFILQGCLEEFEDLDRLQGLNWNPSLAFPIANSSFSFDELISNDELEDFIRIEQDCLIVLYYEESVVSETAESYVEIPDDTFDETINVNAPLIPQLPIELSIEQSEVYEYDFETDEGDLLDSAFISTGTLEVNLLSDFPASGEIEVRFLTVLDDGEPVEQVYPWTYSGSLPSLDQTQTIDLTDVKFDFTDGGTKTNAFAIELTLRLFYEGQAINSSNFLRATVNLIDAEFESVFGQIAERELESDPEVISLDFFSNLTEGSFFLDEPSISFIVDNSFGVPVAVDLQALQVSNETESLSLSGAIADTPQIINAPEIDAVGESVQTTLIVDETNSNLPEMIGILPTEIFYEVDGLINPSEVNTKSFVLRESAIDVDMLVEVPLKGRVSDLRVEQEFEFDGTEFLDDVTDALFRIQTDNGFPLEADLQIYFWDRSGNLLDVLIDGDPTLMEAAPVDGDGNVTSSSEKTVDIVLNAEKISRIKNAETLTLEAIFSTTDDGQQSVKMLNTYLLGVKLGVQTEFDFSL